jgi:hypothetical protein
MVDPTTVPEETENGPREGSLPSGQAAGRWYFPPPLCAAVVEFERRRSIGAHISAYVQRPRRAKDELNVG